MPRPHNVGDDELDRRMKPAFPYADGWLRDAPPRCDRCQGPWQSCDEGWVCRLCGRRFRAVECLQAMVSRRILTMEQRAKLSG